MVSVATDGSEVEPAPQQRAVAAVIYDRSEFLWEGLVLAATFGFAGDLLFHTRGGIGAAVPAAILAHCRIRITVDVDAASLERVLGGIAKTAVKFSDIRNVEVKTRNLGPIAMGSYVRIERVSGKSVQLDTTDPQGLFEAIELVRSAVTC